MTLKPNARLTIAAAGGGACLASSYFLTAFWQNVLTGLATILIAPVIFLAIRRLQQNATTASLAICTLWFVSGAALGVLVVRPSSQSEAHRVEMAKPYPRPDGLIANFTAGAGARALTGLGQEFSLFSDSVWNGSSTVWYGRVNDDTAPGAGFLRVSYSLKAGDASREAWGGVFCDFSLPPPEPFDISKYRRLSLRLRLGQTLRESPIGVTLVLYSANNHPADFVHPSFDVPVADLTTDWTQVRAPFSEFVAPPIASSPLQLDTKQVYRLGIMLRARPGTTPSGHVDVDDLVWQE